MQQPKSAIVVGAGMVGLCCAYALHIRGVKVTIVDRDPVGDKTSYGNAGEFSVTRLILGSQVFPVMRLMVYERKRKG